MSDAAYVVTSKVRHLAAWTADDPSHETFYQTGRYRPICGSKPLTPNETVWPRFPYEDARITARAMRKPVCKHCLKALASLVDLGGAS
jgi:hypothetical protein